MNPAVARLAVILLSFAVLGVSAIFTTLTWVVLSPLQILPRGMLSLFVFVTVYYLAANLIFWRTVVRVSPKTALVERA